MTAAVGARNLFKLDAGVVHALLQARYHDGSKGEFLSEDPVFLGDPRSQVLADPQSLNSYSYGDDNPVRPPHVATTVCAIISSGQSELEFSNYDPVLGRGEFHEGIEVYGSADLRSYFESQGGGIGATTLIGSPF